MRITYRINCLLLLSLFMYAAHASEVVMVVNSSVPVQSVTRSFARAMFGMRVSQWPGDGDAKIFVLPDGHPLHAEFCKKVLDIFPYQLRLAWDRQVFSGTGQAPIEVASEEEMLARIASTPGAMGYLNKGKADADKVKLLAIQN
jgi:ABC-type phosphate transport system substrate-binding protein